MQEQLELTPPPPEPGSYGRGTAAGYARGSETSKDAADIVNETLSERQTRTLLFIGDRGGSAVAWEAAEEFGQTPNNAGPRFTDLFHKGLIRDTGVRRTPPPGLKCGAKAAGQVRELTEAGWRLYRSLRNGGEE